MNAIQPSSCALFLLIAFTLGGLAQTLWFMMPVSGRWAAPVDAGRTFRGRRLFGEHKTWRGFMVMLPAVGLAFWMLASLLQTAHGHLSAAGLWNLSPAAYGALGIWAGFGFMAAELPNSFLKRQWNIAPGAAPEHRLARLVCFVLDRCDSILGALAALSFFVPTPWQLWAIVLLAGGMIHWAFSLLLFFLRAKPRPA